MPKFRVNRPERHISVVEIEAETPKDAVERVRRGEGEEAILEYSDTLDEEKWAVEDEYGNPIWRES